MNKHFIRVSIALLSMMTAMSALAQEEFGANGQKITHTQKADHYFYQRNVGKAPADINDESNSVAQWRALAEWYRDMNDYENAEKAYSYFINTAEPTVTDLYNYVLALKGVGKHEETLPYMRRMREKAPNDLRVKHYFENVNLYKKLKQPSDQYRASVLEINDIQNYLMPSFYVKKQVAFMNSKYAEGKATKCKVKEATSEPDVELSGVKNFKADGWDKKLLNGAFSFAKNGKMVAVTSIDYKNVDKDGKFHQDIYMTSVKQKAWLAPDAFTWNDSQYGYSVAQPALNKQGNVMYFVSDMPGGYGGTDIYVSRKVGKDRWSKPENLGDKINTEGNEMFPFFDGTTGFLYFSSDGHNGLGGLDIYEAEMKDSCTCSYEVRNLGSPINSISDDYGFIFNSKHTNGYFTSNRAEGRGGDDLYKFIYVDTKNPTEAGKNAADDKNKNGSASGDGSFGNGANGANGNFNYGGARGSGMAFTVINSSNGEPVANASVRYNGATYTTDDNGDVVVPMPLKTRGDVSVEAFGYMPRQKGFDYYNKRNNDTISLDIAAGKHIILRNIYYDYDKSDILPESANELDKVVAFLEANPDLTVELSSHTDSRGSDSYNLKLSEDRAQSAVKYIVSKGISASRIKGKGYGETKLLNECANGIECSEEQHRQNRRTEIYIPNFGKAKNVKQTKGKYSSGNGDDAKAKSAAKDEKASSSASASADSKTKDAGTKKIATVGATEKKESSEKAISTMPGTVYKRIEGGKFENEDKPIEMYKESEDEKKARDLEAIYDSQNIRLDKTEDRPDFSKQAEAEEKAYINNQKRKADTKAKYDYAAPYNPVDKKGTYTYILY